MARDGDKVRAAIAFRGREMTHRELGAKILAKLTADLADLADVEVAPKMEGYQMFTIFIPKKAKVPEKKSAGRSRPPRRNRSTETCSGSDRTGRRASSRKESEA